MERKSINSNRNDQKEESVAKLLVLENRMRMVFVVDDNTNILQFLQVLFANTAMHCTAICACSTESKVNVLAYSTLKYESRIGQRKM